MRMSRAVARRALVLLAGAAALGVGALMFAPAAGAEPIVPTGGLEKGCSLNASDGLYFFPPGTRITVQLEDGQKETFKCVNGEWVKEMSVLTGGTLSAGTFYAGTRTFVRSRSGTVAGTTSGTFAR
jgi:hypothetical protein